MHDENKLLGGYRGIVKDVNDPDKLGRVKVFIPSIMSGNADDQRQWTNWCEPKFVLAGVDGQEDVGSIVVPPVGSRVWIEFEMGDPDFPVYSGGMYQAATDTSPPKVSRGEDDGLTPSTTSKGGVTVQGSRANTPQYPLNTVFRTPKGITIELDDTSDDGRVRVQLPGGPFVELANDVIRVHVGAAGTIELAAAGDVLVAGANVKLGVDAKVYAGSATALHPVIIDNNFLANLQTVLTALSTFATGADAAIPAALSPPLVAAITSMLAALTSYRATKLNAE